MWGLPFDGLLISSADLATFNVSIHHLHASLIALALSTRKQCPYAVLTMILLRRSNRYTYTWRIMGRSHLRTLSVVVPFLVTLDLEELKK